MPSTANCPHCVRPLSSNAPKGLCPACLASSLSDLLGEAAGEEMIPPQLAAPNERLGDYELLDELGRGGMGVVFRARDRRLNRTVALKLMLTGKLALGTEVKRFRNEAEAAAQLEHPNIVPIYDVGESEGRHFFAMKLLEGGSLISSKRKAISAQYSAINAARTVAKVARAVHHGHQRGILHRDLKPGNILFDVTGEPMVTDFGLARRLEGDSELTLSGTVVGSPSYMAPEQAAGRSHEVTTAADIYSLGAILYELLCGQPPFVADTPAATMRRVMEEEPVPPTAVAADVRRRKSPEHSGARLLTSVATSVNRDLETICLKCLEKEPTRRYASAAALADDLERWQRGEPVLARPTGIAGRGWKWARRRPALAALLTLAGAALAGFVAMRFVNEAKLTRERDRATTNEVFALAEARRAESNALIARLNLYAADMFLVGRALDEGNLALASRTLEGQVPRAGEEDLRGFEWRYFENQARGAQFHTFTNFTEAVFSVAFSPDGRWLAAAGANLVHWWNATNRQLVATLTHDNAVKSICFSADGATLWTGDSRGQVRAWRQGANPSADLIHRGTGLVHVAAPAGAANYAAFGERDHYAGKGRGEIMLYHLPDAIAPNGRGRALTNSGGLTDFSHDGQWLLTGGGDSAVTLRNLVTGETKSGICQNMETLAIALSPNAGTIAVAAYAGYSLVLYHVAERRMMWLNMGFNGCIHGLAFAPDGQTLALACSDHTIRLCSADNGRVIRRLVGHMAEVFAVAFSPDGETLLSGGVDRAARLWRLGTNAAATDTLTGVFRPLAFSSDSRTLIAATGRGLPLQFVNFDLATLQRRPGPALPSWADEYPAVWHPRNSGSLPWLLHGNTSSSHVTQFKAYIASCTNYESAVCASGGSVVAIGRSDGVVLAWDTVTAARLPDLRTGRGAVKRLAVSGDGRVIATAGDGNVVAVWEAATGATRFRLPSRENLISALALSLDGGLLAVGLVDTTVELRDAITGAWHGTLAGHSVPVLCMAFSPDDRTLATSASTTLKLWHVSTRREVATLSGALDARVLMFSPDGAILAGATETGETRLWTGRPSQDSELLP